MHSKRHISREDGTLGILLELEQEPRVSQRSLANRLGIALGVTNLLIHRLVRNGYIRVRKVKANRIAYFLTPSGLAEKTRMVQERFSVALASYAEAKHRIMTRLDHLEDAWPSPAGGREEGRHVFLLGVTEASEIAYLCLQGSALTLVGFADAHRQGSFLELPVYPIDGHDRELAALLDSTRPVIVAFRSGPAELEFLERYAIPPARFFLL